MIGGRRPLHGRKLADRRVRVERPHTPYFRYTGPGQLVAKPAASAPTTRIGRAFARAKSILLGRPLASEEEIGERLPKVKALPIFSSDAVSSSAYATDEIMRVLVLAGTAALFMSVEVALAIALLLAIVSTSYRQVCRAYPSGGGAYVVARENLSQLAGLVAAAALFIDYVMTVAVSTASAVSQAYSVWPALFDIRIELAIVSISLITVANLRGLRESGNIFAIPTYAFVGLALAMIGLGVIHYASGTIVPVATPAEVVRPPDALEPLTILLLLKAFAGGSVALTGVEAIANGVPAFKPPESRNAANTMSMMAVLLGVLFVGITFVGVQYHIMPTNEGGPTAIAQVATAVFGAGSPVFVLFQVSTALILFLAVNTSFNAFPRLAAILAEDGFMPRQFSFRGDRLAFSWGIAVLAAVAALLLVVFQGDVHLLIPLYSVGVFVCFTLSQIGMVRHWRTVRDSGCAWRALLNGAGAALTFVVLVVVASVKFVNGAWLVVVLIPIQVAIFLFINRQYRASAAQLAIRQDFVVPPPHREERVVIPVPGLNRAVVQAVNVGRSISDDVRAVFISDDPDETARVRTLWERQVPGVPLVIVESPYRALAGPFLAYLDVLDRAWPPGKEEPITFVVVPEYVARNWWERILYNQSAKRLRAVLLGRPYTVIVAVPYRREDRAAFDASMSAAHAAAARHAGRDGGPPSRTEPAGTNGR
ncbi:MAG TPA: APC family permease [Candidatus Dormibacteraeota bacterium]|nr:APC family permease [Candidatus Dormibacteraeota bacterium]